MAMREWQDWKVGSRVAIGFMNDLRVIEKVTTPGDGKPDAYILSNESRTRTYRFVPYNGVERLD